MGDFTGLHFPGTGSSRTPSLEGFRRAAAAAAPQHARSMKGAPGNASVCVSACQTFFHAGSCCLLGKGFCQILGGPHSSRPEPSRGASHAAANVRHGSVHFCVCQLILILQLHPLLSRATGLLSARTKHQQPSFGCGCCGSAKKKKQPFSPLPKQLTTAARDCRTLISAIATMPTVCVVQYARK